MSDSKEPQWQEHSFHEIAFWWLSQLLYIYIYLHSGYYKSFVYIYRHIFLRITLYLFISLKCHAVTFYVYILRNNTFYLYIYIEIWASNFSHTAEMSSFEIEKERKKNKKNKWCKFWTWCGLNSSCQQLSSLRRI